MKALAEEKRLLGQILVEQGKITPEQLRIALQKQKDTGARLGQVLVSLGYLTEDQLIKTLEDQLGVSRVNLKEIKVDHEAIEIVPKQLAQKYKVFPVKRTGDRLSVAMSDPLNLAALDDLHMSTGLLITPLLSTEAEIDEAISKFYGLPYPVEAALRQLSADEAVEEAEEGPIIRLVNSIIERAVRMGASDIHFSPEEDAFRIRYRLDGFLQDVMSLPKQSHPPITSRLKIMARMDIAEKRVPQDGRIQMTVDGSLIDLRVSSLPTVLGEKVVLRVLDPRSALKELDELGFNPEALERFRAIIHSAYGLVMVTGPTGSGKTTTLYAALRRINDRTRNIVTLEDPVEYMLPGISQVQVNTKVGLSFASGLRSILRQDPDIIMVGEVRDPETAAMAIRSAMTGHLVLSTVHTNDAIGAIYRLIDMGIEPYLVASSVIGVVAQRLVRLVCTRCAESYELAPDAPERQILQAEPDQPVVLRRGRGCTQCNHTGYKGRAAVSEVVPISARIRELISKRAPADELKQVAVEEGMITMQQDGLNKVLQGVTTLEEVLRCTQLVGVDTPSVPGVSFL